MSAVLPPDETLAAGPFSRLQEKAGDEGSPTAAQIAISIELAGLISPGLMMPTCGT